MAQAAGGGSVSVPVADIVADFRGAAKPDLQIKILSDIYQKSPHEIACILRDAGVLPDSINPDGFSVKFRPVAAAKEKKRGASAEEPKASRRKKPMRAGRPHVEIDDARFMELYAEGLSDKSIADAMGCSDGTIQRYRAKKGIESNYIRGKKKEKRTMGEKTKWPGAQASPEEVNETSEPQLPQEGARDDEGMSVRRFTSLLAEILTPSMQSAALCINGAPVLEVNSVVLHAAGGKAVVDVRIDNGGKR